MTQGKPREGAAAAHATAAPSGDPHGPKVPRVPRSGEGPEGTFGRAGEGATGPNHESRAATQVPVPPQGDDTRDAARATSGQAPTQVKHRNPGAHAAEGPHGP